MSNLCETLMSLAVVHNDPTFGSMYPFLEDSWGIVNNNNNKKNLEYVKLFAQYLDVESFSM